MVKVSTKDKKYFWLMMLIILASTSFFNPVFIENIDNISKFILYASIAFFLLITISKKRLTDKKFNLLIMLVAICQCVSAYNAYRYNGQGLIVGLISTMQSGAYITYIALSKSGLSLRRCEKLIYWMSIIFCLVAVVDRFYPIFGTMDIDLDRGGERFRLPAAEWATFGLIFSIGKLMQNLSRKYLILAICCMLAVFSTVTRQVIAISLLIATLMILQNAKWYKKILLIFVFVFGYLYVLPQIPIVNKLMQLTQEQKNASYDNIRITAFYYLAFEPRNVQQVLFGMGIPAFGKSTYGNQFQWMSQETGIYREDLGWAGFYYNHGIIAMLTVLVIMIMAMCVKTPKKYTYLKYYVLSFLLYNIASGEMQVNYGIVSFVLAVYMINLSHLQLEDKRPNVRIEQKRI